MWNMLPMTDVPNSEHTTRTATVAITELFRARMHTSITKIFTPFDTLWPIGWTGPSSLFRLRAILTSRESPIMLLWIDTGGTRPNPMAQTDRTRATAVSPPGRPVDDEAALVAAAKGGDLHAFETLVHRYEGRIYRLTYNISQNREDAEDSTQDAFLKAYQHLADFQGDSRFYTWLVRIAVNETLMKLRRRRPGEISLDESIQTDEDMVPREIEDWGPKPDQRFEQAELQSILARSIAQLEPPYRIVFQLRDIEELSTEETARLLGLSIPAVKSRLLRARLKLRHTLDQLFRGGARSELQGS